MNKLRLYSPRFLGFAAAACFVTAAQAATVGLNGYTNDFSSLPAVVDWSQYDLTGANSTITTAAQMDTAIAAITAGTVNTVLVTDGNTPPGANATGNWNTSGFLYTRPTGNSASLIMVTLTNGIGSDAGTVNLSYDFTRVGSVAEDDPAFNGLRAYYSLNGLANDWTNIPEFNVMVGAFISG